MPEFTETEINAIRLALSSMLVGMRDRGEDNTSLYATAEQAYRRTQGR